MNCVIWLIFLLFFLTFSYAENIKYFNENDIPEFKYLDTSVNPCDDFYKYACGNFHEFYSLDNRNIVDHFTILEDELVKIGREILSSLKNDDDPVSVRKAKSAFRSCMSVQQLINEFSPELRIVNQVGGMPLLSSSNNDSAQFSWNDIGDLVGKYGVPLIFNIEVSQTTQKQSIILLSPDPLNNPTLFRPKISNKYDEVIEESLRKFSKRMKRAAVTPFDTFLRTLARNLLKSTNPAKTDEEVIDDLNDMAGFMRQLYAGGILLEETLPLDTQVTIGQLQEWTDLQFMGQTDMNWIDYLNRIFQMSGVTVTNDTIIRHRGVNHLVGVLNLVQKSDPKAVKNFALLRVFLFQAPDSNYATRKAFEDYYVAKGYELYPRSEYCARKILDIVDTASLSYAVTFAYLRYQYNATKISQANQLVQNIQEAVKNILGSTEWMDADSSKAAVQKLENMLLLLSYPEFVDDASRLDAFYGKLQICQSDNYGNSQQLRAFKQAYQLSQLVKPDRYFWGKSTFDPNAYYNRPNNKIVLPISMLNPVFLYGDNPVLDYSRLGSIIGHEITHGFDVNGKNYNQDGELESWWTESTMNAFLNKTSCFIKQYNNYYVPGIDTYVNGTTTINENLADNGGIRASFEAFKSFIKNNAIETTGNYSLEQMFFIGYGTMWCSLETDYALRVLVAPSSAYPPKRFRVIGTLSNMKEFSDAFACPVDSPMNPESKCILW